jgi:hypothetical protein
MKMQANRLIEDGSTFKVTGSRVLVDGFLGAGVTSCDQQMGSTVVSGNQHPIASDV